MSSEKPAVLPRRLTQIPGGGVIEDKIKSNSVPKMSSSPAPVVIPTPVRFAFGTAAAISATFFTHPVDVVKYATQLRSEGGSSLSAVTDIYKSSGVRGFYKGLSASMMRQASYGTTRLGIYSSLMEHFKREDGRPPPLWQKLGFSMAAGSIGAFVGNPFDLALVRMAADSTLPEAERRNYTSVFEAVSRIIRTEGFTSLWIGAGPTISRCVVLNMAQLSTYSQAKEEFLESGYFQDNIWCHLASSMVSGFIATAASTPFDVAKTRIQYDRTGQYKGMTDCLVKTARHEGVTSLWKGFGPAYFRLAPQTVLIFVFLEQFQKAYLERLA
mmetsp:Transcript_23289/g.41178  ORF Transcript_23289/g.41178 Transcript_23289/m.41178 type:complete len:327 (-) Transcript_23289:136-1116(-)|eukprot:CAMPEP_0184507964 /NCGR_PEP_ID=MMETSP0198_2-20121128/512_1 /TAXON_ID=1112570 /ORGANISM="Thraustochytrium sp., Strain LLF1b" /LENGTH=326 /DNA_ID=CAMNT_0026897725 /DNA_START=352 /DNA_END=1332 /DNA_ORIENTATION=-